MPWFKVDDGFHGHPKVMPLSTAAVGIWTLTGSWCAQYLTDGVVHANIVRRFGGTSENVRELVDAALWIDNGDDTYQFKDWEDYQPVKADVEAERAAARERMRKVRQQKKSVKPTKTDNAGSGNVHPNVRPNFDRSSQGVRVTPTQPDPARPDPFNNTSQVANATLQPAEEIVDVEVFEDDHEPVMDAPATDDDTTDNPAADDRPDVELILDTIDAHCDHHDFKKPARTKRNHDAARLLLDNDGRTVDEVVDVLRFVTMNDFWPDKIRSATKLRERFDQLKFQAQRKTDQPAPAAFMTADQRRLQAGYDREQEILANGFDLDAIDAYGAFGPIGELRA